MKKTILGLALFASVNVFGQNLEKYRGKEAVFVPDENKTYIMNEVIAEQEGVATHYFYNGVVGVENGNLIDALNTLNGGAFKPIVKGESYRRNHHDVGGNYVGSTCLPNGNLCIILLKKNQLHHN